MENDTIFILHPKSIFNKLFPFVSFQKITRISNERKTCGYTWNTAI